MTQGMLTKDDLAPVLKQEIEGGIISPSERAKIQKSLQPNSWWNTEVVNVGYDRVVKNMGAIPWTDTTTSQCAYLVLGDREIWGSIELTLTASYNNSNSGGMAKVVYNVGLAGGGIEYHNRKEIAHMSDKISDNYFFGELLFIYGVWAIPIYKRLYNNNNKLSVTINSSHDNGYLISEGLRFIIETQGSVITNPKQKSDLNQFISESADVAQFGRNNNQSIASGQTTEVVFQTVSPNNIAYIDPGTGRIHVLRDGTYQFTLKVTYSANPTGARYSSVSGITSCTNAVANVPTDVVSTAQFKLYAGQQINALAVQTSGVALDVTLETIGILIKLG